VVEPTPKARFIEEICFFFSVLFIDFPEQQGLVYRILDITIGTLFVATETPGCCDKIP
jgi:hypothetical protein